MTSQTDDAMTEEAMAQSFWNFSTGLYAAPGVEAHLLALQDRDGLDVNLVLFCLFAAHVRRPLDYGAVEAMRGLALAWGLGVVAPLRPRDLAAAHFAGWFRAEGVENDGLSVIADALINAAFPPA